ncbi:MAG TPA: SHOCT domain-containing protein [Nitrospiraceae bacterium]|nr:SHOCT domain-containing protein [Nitrospiraceae bacterium]
MAQKYFDGVQKATVVLLATGMIGLLGQACRGPAPPAPIACGTCEDQDRIVRLQPAPPGEGQAAFAHPFLLNPDDWKVILKSIHVQRQSQGFLIFTSKDAVEPAFTDDEVEYLSTTLSRVFGHASRNERVVFAVSRHQPADITEVTSGGWFVQGPSLHLVLANYRFAVTMASIRELLWQDPMWTQAGPSYDFVPGDHQTVAPEEDSVRRLISLRLPLLSIAYKPLLLGESSVSAAVPSGSTGRELSPPPTRPSPPSKSVEERLQMLKRMREQELITEEEYRAKKRQLLEQF